MDTLRLRHAIPALRPLAQGTTYACSLPAAPDAVAEARRTSADTGALHGVRFR